MARPETSGKNKLALFGGPPAVTGDLRAAGAGGVVTDWAKAKVNELLDAGGIGLSMSPMIQELEAAFADYTGAKYCLSMVNGTAGIRTALWICQVGPGDEVICPSFTWWPTTVPAASMGAKVVFAEIEPDTLGLDPEDVEKRITSRTKAVVVVHVMGMPANLDGLAAVCKKHGLPLIEDACLAPGARYRGRCVGTFGEFGIFSMQEGKVERAKPSSESLKLKRENMSAKIKKKVANSDLLVMRSGLFAETQKSFSLHSAGDGPKCRALVITGLTVSVQEA